MPAVGLVAYSRINASCSMLAALFGMRVFTAWQRASAALPGLAEHTFGW